MRQVPHYLIIGNGRVARHLQYYLSLLSLPCHAWHRHESTEQLQDLIKKCSHILILISDHAIINFAKENLSNTHSFLLHFSGSLVSDVIYGAHPLMCFTNHLYTLPEYQSIPFIIDHDAPEWDELLPGLPNPHIRLQKSLKAKYHALCVLAGNFGCLLWKKLFDSFEKELHLPSSLAYPFLLKQAQNMIQDPNTALTGPLIRQDWITIEKNLAALDQDVFQDVYKSFVKCYEETLV